MYKKSHWNFGYKIAVALKFDEMAIKRSIEYTSNKFVAMIDMGRDIDVDKNVLATQALVFSVVTINVSWKFPIGYYLINGIDTEQKQNWVLQAASILHMT